MQARYPFATITALLYLTGPQITDLFRFTAHAPGLERFQNSNVKKIFFESDPRLPMLTRKLVFLDQPTFFLAAISDPFQEMITSRWKAQQQTSTYICDRSQQVL